MISNMNRTATGRSRKRKIPMPTRPRSAIGLKRKMLFPGLSSRPSSPRPIGV